LCFFLLLFNSCSETEEPGLEYDIYTTILNEEINRHSRERNIRYGEERIQELKMILAEKDKIPFVEDHLIKRMYENHGEDTAERIESLMHYKQRILEGQKKSLSSVVLISETEHEIYNEDFTTYKDYLQTMSFFDKRMYNDFVRKNVSPINILPIEKFGKEVTYLTPHSLTSVFEGIGAEDDDELSWNRFYYEFGDQPVIWLSRPGFNKDKTKALIYFEQRSGTLSGSGLFLILEKWNEEWIVTEELMVWIS